jgi:hypothetical protein
MNQLSSLEICAIQESSYGRLPGNGFFSDFLPATILLSPLQWQTGSVRFQVAQDVLDAAAIMSYDAFLPEDVVLAAQG